MKKNKLIGSVLMSFIVGMLFASCGGGNKATIKGSVINASGQTLYLEELNVDVRKVVDSVKLTDKGSFAFTYVFTKNEPSFLVLRANTLTLGTLLLEKGEKIKYEADAKQPFKYTISGSEGSALVKELNDSLAVTMEEFNVLKKRMFELDETDPSTGVSHEINLQMGALMAKHKRSLIRFIITHPKSFASFTAIYQKVDNTLDLFGKNDDILYYRTLVDSLSPLHPQSPYVQILNADYERIERAIKLKSLLENATETDFVEVELSNEKEEKVKLSTVQAKVILIDFWTSQDVNCLLNNKELQETYTKYRSRGFEVYQISEDKAKEKWLETISNQNLLWINVIDSPDSRAARTYNIQGLPCNFLVSKTGEFIGRNLYGAELDKALATFLR